MIDIALARRRAAAAGFCHLVAHQYGAIDIARLFALASTDTADLLEFCRTLVRRAREAAGGS